MADPCWSLREGFSSDSSHHDLFPHEKKKNKNAQEVIKLWRFFFFCPGASYLVRIQLQFTFFTPLVDPVVFRCH